MIATTLTHMAARQHVDNMRREAEHAHHAASARTSRPGRRWMARLIPSRTPRVAATQS